MPYRLPDSWPLRYDAVWMVSISWRGVVFPMVLTTRCFGICRVSQDWLLHVERIGIAAPRQSWCEIRRLILISPVLVRLANTLHWQIMAFSAGRAGPYSGKFASVISSIFIFKMHSECNLSAIDQVLYHTFEIFKALKKLTSKEWCCRAFLRIEKKDIQRLKG